MLLSKGHCAKAVVFSIFCIRCMAFSGLGPCLKLDYMNNFNSSKFAGHWYEIEHSFYLMELVQSCVNMDLTEIDNGRLEISVTSKSTWSGSFSISEGVAIPTKKNPSIFLYKVSTNLPRMFNRYLPGAGLYQVLMTDYNNYALIYSCSNYQLMHLDLIWIWGRRREIDAEIRADIYSLLNKYQLDSERLILAKHDNCTDN